MIAELTKETIQQQAPAVYGNQHAMSKAMSKAYSQVNTGELIDRLSEHGLVPVRVSQDNPRKRNPLTVAHKVHLQPVDLLKREEGTPELIIVNSHNGRTRLKIFAGIFRLICTNGMVAGTSVLPPVMARHYKDAVGAALDQAMEAAEHLTRLGAVVDDWSAVELSEARQQTFAQQAAELRWGKGADQRFKPGQLLEARRSTDAGDDLWHVFNRVQENTTKGQLLGASANGRAIRTRGLTQIEQDIKYNAQLWELAEKVAA